MEKLDSLKQFLRNLQQVPYLASKNLFRVAAHFLEMDKEKCEFFCATLLNMKEKLIKCSKCFVWKEKNKDCDYCDSLKRDKSLICVIENWQDLLAMERSADYRGIYHVLGGSISPLDGIGPEDLTINNLYERAKSESVKELILALNQTPEGEVTSAYIANKLKNLDVQITCLARGVPMGSSLEYLDKLTLNKAFIDRRPF